MRVVQRASASKRANVVATTSKRNIVGRGERYGRRRLNQERSEIVFFEKDKGASSFFLKLQPFLNFV
ncbi:hypothetical protein MTR_5g084400 [Medicago truncatula]|uniref:Uncharacterized protein n=1 Tax=Medicago truncatula TaxID=3880 RepID=G7K7C8_MEDTR|nr:hypothetical protein MTR_5g084400 [Medicago truncatula]